MAPNDIDARCEALIAESRGEVREWADQNPQLVQTGWYRRLADHLYASGAVKCWVGDYEELYDEHALIHSFIVELPEDAKTREQVVKKYVELAKRLENDDDSLQHVGERFILFDTSQ